MRTRTFLGVVCYFGAGAWPPMLALALELRERGHRVVLACDEGTRAQIAEHGFDAIVVPEDIEVDRSLTARRVVEVLNRIAFERGLPKTIRVDHGSEFTSNVFDQWAYKNGVEIDFTRSRKPTDNTFIESFNGRVRQECLNEN